MAIPNKLQIMGVINVTPDSFSDGGNFYHSGKVDIDPKDGVRTCEKSWCEMHSLCRINELESGFTEHMP